MNFYVVIADKHGNWTTDVGNRRWKVDHQRDAVKGYAAKHKLKEGESYVVLLLPESPGVLSWYTCDRLAKLDWDYWTFDENLNQHGEGEGPPITL